MGCFVQIRFTVLAVALAAAAVVVFAPGARADIPMCNDVQTARNDGTDLVTCTCTCEASSKFPACAGSKSGTSVPTPGSCADMLQGRRVISRGDWLVINDPHDPSSGKVKASVNIYAAESTDPDGNDGIGEIKETPPVIAQVTVPCTEDTPIPFPQQSRSARLFDQAKDSLVFLRPSESKADINSSCAAVPGGAGNMLLEIAREADDQNNLDSSTFTFPFTFDAQYVHLAIDDFDLDGFDDILVLNHNEMQVFSAADTTGGSDTLRHGSPVLTGGPKVPINEPTTGDFNGDGIIDVAWIGGNFTGHSGELSVFFASVCPGDVAGTLCQGHNTFDIILDPGSALHAGDTSTIVLPDASVGNTRCGASSAHDLEKNIGLDSLRPGAVMLGNFEGNGSNANSAPAEELMVLYLSGNDSVCKVDLYYYRTDPLGQHWFAQESPLSITNLYPEVTKKDFSSAPENLYQLHGQAIALDWYGATEQAALAISGSFKVSGEGLWESRHFVVTVAVGVDKNDSQTLTACRVDDLAKTTKNDPPILWGMTAGVFTPDQVDDDIEDVGDACGNFDSAVPGQCSYNPQIALLVANAHGDSSTDTKIVRYTFQPSDPDGSKSSLKCSNDKSIATPYLPFKYENRDINNFSKVQGRHDRAGSFLHAGDLSGLSQRVGPPTIARITEHTQQQIVVQTPPSLVDYVQPNKQDSTTPAIVNFTLSPSNYFAVIEFETSSNETASTQKTTSHSSSTTESVGFEAKFNEVPLVEGIDVKTTESWTQMHEHNTSNQLSNYSSTTLETNVKAGGDDQVWWTQTTFNVFHYPVIGQTTCPQSLTCDDSDPNTTGCTAAASGVTLTCSKTGDGCDCLSDGASASLCPAIPSDINARSCAEQGDVCCSLLQQQLNMTLSGPEEVTRSSGNGALIEWYHPRHEPTQILSHPSNVTLLEARMANAVPLGGLDPFSIGTNVASESISYTCGTDGTHSVGTTTTHSFESDSSITAGTPNLSNATDGANVTVGFDYNHSHSTSTLNSYTVGQAASSSVALNLDGAGFLDPDEYAYDVAGVVLGADKPKSVLDERKSIKAPCPPDQADCTEVEDVQADCTTTGPLTVAFAANPTGSGKGIWWGANSAYSQNIDVALNNPSRWNNVSSTAAANPDLQCRGFGVNQSCYTINQPEGTGASDVWAAQFYNMKGLLVTLGEPDGPQRDTATVGDTIVLRARVSNYSLKSMAPGTRVFTRFYRQQLDVNNDEGFSSVVDYATGENGKPLPAVPIGPTGLGDTDPIPVVSPQDGSATIPPFNTSNDPANDNISIATTFYTASEDDDCEYHDGVKPDPCDGAYYAYWVTVWAEDASGNVLTELPGHGLNMLLGNTFNGSTTYDFITDVPLELVNFNGKLTTFSNNVAMYKKVFAILPEDAGVASADAGPADFMIDLLRVVPEQTVVGKPVVVAAQVVSLGAATPGATVVFTDGDPDNGGTAFDAEWLPHIRADDAHFVRAAFRPETCGLHEIVVEATSARRGRAEASVWLPVPCSPDDVDGDGVPNADDECEYSDLSSVVVVEGCNTGVANVAVKNGCTIADHAMACEETGGANHQKAGCMTSLTNYLGAQRLITGEGKKAMRSCARLAYGR